MFLDELIFGIVSNVASAGANHAARKTLRFTGGATVTDDPGNNETVINISGGGGGGDPAMGGDIAGTASAAVVNALTGTSGALSIVATKLTSPNQHEHEGTLSLAASASGTLCVVTLPNNAGSLRASAIVTIASSAGTATSWKIDSAVQADPMGSAYVLLAPDTSSAKPASPVHTVAITWGVPGASDACKISVTNGDATNDIKVAAALHILRVSY